MVRQLAGRSKLPGGKGLPGQASLSCAGNQESPVAADKNETRQVLARQFRSWHTT